MKKIIAITMALIMCLGIMSMAVFAAGGKMTVNVVAPSDWAEIYVYTWDANNNALLGQWPGAKMTGTSFELDAAPKGIVLNNGQGKQTVDINDLQFTAGGSATIKLGEPGSDGKYPYTIEYGSTPTPTTTTNPGTTTATPTTATTSSGKRMLTIEAPATWTEVYVYTWDPKDFGDDFPGTKLTKSGGVYEVEIKSTMSNLIVAGRLADTTLKQTPDITLAKDSNSVKIRITSENGDYEIIGGGSTIDRFVVTNDPAATKTTGTASTYRVVGGGATDANGKELYNGAWLGSWQPGNDVGLMYEVESGLYRKNFENVQPGEYKLKITKDGGWDVSYGDGDDGKKDCEFKVDSACTITVDFKIENGIGYIKLYGVGVEPQPLGDISMLSVVVLMALASVTAVVLVVNKKKFI